MKVFSVVCLISFYLAISAAQNAEEAKRIGFRIGGGLGFRDGLSVGFGEMDKNKDGKIDRAEFHWAYPRLDAWKDFARYDIDNDGFIDSRDPMESRNWILWVRYSL